MHAGLRCRTLIPAYIKTVDALAVCQLFFPVRIPSALHSHFLELADEWDEHQKTTFILGVGEGSMEFDIDQGDIDDLDIEIYSNCNISELAEQFVDDGVFGDFPGNLINYIDYDAIAYDLSMDYCESVVAGERVVYRCA